MNSFFDKLNLRPAERRVLVAVMLALFVVVNLLWVWPRFGDWTKAQIRFKEIETKTGNYQKLIKDKSIYQRRLSEFESGSQEIPPEEQGSAFTSTIQNLARQCGVHVPNTARTLVTTNENFVQHTQRVQVIGDDSALVNFLYRLGDSNSQVPIRVKEMSLNPQGQRYKLDGQVTLVASFQRKLNIRAPLPAARPTTGAAPTAVTAPQSGTSTRKAGATTAQPTNKPPMQVKK